MFNQAIRPAVMAVLILTFLTGFVYTGLVTGVSQIFFSNQANGSLIKENQQIVGSALIGQSFTQANQFWGRPSATSDKPYNALASGGMNKAVDSEDLKQVVKQRIEALVQSGASPQEIPVDLVTASASGLDPDISPAAAYYQAKRVAEARHMSIEAVNQLIKAHIEDRQLGFLGEPRVNVLKLNLALDRHQ